jgi:hypothetical protein
MDAEVEIICVIEVGTISTYTGIVRNGQTSAQKIPKSKKRLFSLKSVSFCKNKRYTA